MALSLEKDVLLFFEDHDRDTFVRNDRRIRTFLRKTSYLVRPRKQVFTGFEVAFLQLKKALERVGRRVHVNAYGLARRNPRFPIGITGYPHILIDWKLPNPAVLGPGLYDHPAQAPDLMKDPRFKRYTVSCDWYGAIFAAVYGADRIAHWYAGLDGDEWPDLSGKAKDLDVLIYDKIPRGRQTVPAEVLGPVEAELKRRGLRTATIQYKYYVHAEYRALLARTRSMIWLAEHETQGIAYQEALSSGVPLCAWDPGVWTDPLAKRYESRQVPASSIPYFGPECGEWFRKVDEFPAALGRMMDNLPNYRPREFVRRELSLEGSANLYLKHLAAAAST